LCICGKDAWRSNGSAPGVCEIKGTVSKVAAACAEQSACKGFWLYTSGWSNRTGSLFNKDVIESGQPWQANDKDLYVRARE
jgi:hypothetical protein